MSIAIVFGSFVLPFLLCASSYIPYFLCAIVSVTFSIIVNPPLDCVNQVDIFIEVVLVTNVIFLWTHIFLSSGTVSLACVIPHAGFVGCLRAGIAVRSALHTFSSVGWKLERCMRSNLNTPFNRCWMTIYVCMYLLVAQSGHGEPILAWGCF